MIEKKTERYYLSRAPEPQMTPGGVMSWQFLPGFDLADIAQYIAVELCERFMAEASDGPMHKAIRKAWAIVHIADLEAKIRSHGEEP